MYPEGIGTVKALPPVVGSLSAVEIDWGFAYD
jgi:hypothetical protein